MYILMSYMTQMLLKYGNPTFLKLIVPGKRKGEGCGYSAGHNFRNFREPLVQLYKRWIT